MSGSVLNPICRGLVGYISFLAPCTASPVYTEYLLYEPLYRIATAQGFKVRAEVPVIYGPKRAGDHKRIDFVLEKNYIALALELKWIKNQNPNISKDVEKLKTYNTHIKDAAGYVILFGKYADVASAKPVYAGSKLGNGKIVHWDSGKTHYACSWVKFT
ncbi:hypothetical protein [Algiphilus sp.]|uniref:hypothetical protein n=1 Tax=Algiphilus sp. TaxID=1872431 RepID=UPI0032EC7559